MFVSHTKQKQKLWLQKQQKREKIKTLNQIKQQNKYKTKQTMLQNNKIINLCE